MRLTEDHGLMAPNPSGEQLDIGFGDQRAVVVEVGGGLRSYTAAGADVLDGYGADEMCTSGRGQVLMPWPNRIADGSYELDGRRHQLALSEPENGNAIHGLVRWTAWSVAERDAHRVTVEHVTVEGTEYDFRDARAIGATKLDNAFTTLSHDGDGVARVVLRDPQSGTEITVWVDDGRLTLAG